MSSRVFIYIAWVISLTATMGSLFFSEVMEFPPCTLCWYQRIAMYPLVIIFFVGKEKSLKDVLSYSLPFVLTGWIFSLYHNLLHYEIIPESAAPCQEGVSCSTVYIEIFNFLTIPMMALIAFSLIGCCLIMMQRKLKSEQ